MKILRTGIASLFILVGSVGLFLSISFFYIGTLVGKLGFIDCVLFSMYAGLSLHAIVFFAIDLNHSLKHRPKVENNP